MSICLIWDLHSARSLIGYLNLELSIIVQSVNPQNYSRQPVTGLPPSSSGMLPEEDPPDLKYIF